MFTAAVHSFKRLFMEKRDKTVSLSDLLDHLHDELVLVDSNIYLGVYTREFMLRRSYLVVLCLGKHAKFPELPVELFHESRYLRLYRPEIVVIEFLPLRRHHSEQGPPGKSQVRSLVIQIARHQKVFLLRSCDRVYSSYAVISHKPQYPHGLTVEGIHRPEK